MSFVDRLESDYFKKYLDFRLDLVYYGVLL